MPLPSYERVVFAKAPLGLVLAQIRFPVLFRFEERPFLASFHDAIRRAYPQAALEQQVGVKISGKGAETTGEQNWRFSDATGAWSVVLGDQAVTLESRAYESFSPFLERFRHVAQSVVDHLGVSERTRLGLRFVNELRADGASTLADWGRLLNPAFVGFGVDHEGLGDRIEHAFQELQCRQENGTLAIRHGLLQGTTIMRPASLDPPGGPFYLLDLDFSDPSMLSLDVDATCRQLRSFNEAMYRFFRWALDGGTMFEKLEPLR